MTARADRLTDGAKTPDNAGVVRSFYPARSVRVFVSALERLDYRMAPLLADAGIHRADLDDPGARISRSVWGRVFSRALEQRPMKNAGMRLATVTPFGAFPLIDYLIATSQNVGEGLTRLGRYLRSPRLGPFLTLTKKRIRLGCYSKVLTRHFRPSLR